MNERVTQASAQVTVFQRSIQMLVVSFSAGWPQQGRWIGTEGSRDPIARNW